MYQIQRQALLAKGNKTEGLDVSLGRVTRALVMSLVALAAALGAWACSAGEAPAPAPAKTALPPVPAMATVASFPTLYAANNENWTSFAVKDDQGYRVLNAKASGLPGLMYVRPGDALNLVLQENGGQSWVLSATIVGKDGQPVEVQQADSDTVTEIDKADGKIALIKTRKGLLYHVDVKLATFDFFDGKATKTICWLDNLKRNCVFAARFIQRGDSLWAVGGTLTDWGKKTELRNIHGEQPIVQKMIRNRFARNHNNDYWYYVYTQFPNIKYEVDSRWYTDVRLQRVGEPPHWHKDREPSQFSELAVLGPRTQTPPIGVSVVVEGDTISNNMSGSIASTNVVSSVNTNSNTNRSTNVNSNSNANSNENNNANSNTNQNQNENNNANSNSNSNTNQNQNSLRNRSSLRNGGGQQ